MRLRNATLVATIAVLLAGCASTGEKVAKTVVVDTQVATDKTHNAHQKLVLEGLDYLAQGDTAAASKAFNKALQLNPRESDYHLLNALTYHVDAVNGNSGSYDLAKEGYELAVKFDPSNWLAHYMFGRLHIELNEFDQAKAELAEAIALKNDEPDVLKSMVYAAYRAYDPETAAAMVQRLEQLGELRTPMDLKNAAMVLAAVGDEEGSTRYLKRLKTSETPDWRTEQAVDRVHEWDSLYQNRDALIKTQWGAPTAGGFGASGGGGGTAGSTNPDEQKMVVVDVVIIRTEETLGTNRGINLLNGLKIQFGDNNGSYYKQARTDTIGGFSAGVSETITRSVSIPSLSYSMNIFNTAGQRNEILARPTIIAMSGQQSEFFSGVELNAAAVATGAQGGQSISIQKQVGIKLAVTPSFLEDGRINMKVEAERTFLKTPSSDVNFTFRVETSKTSVRANVAMRYGETLILSGLSEKESENARDGVPFLQDIPLIQYFFSNEKTKEFQKSVLILVTPRPTQYVYQTEKAREEFEKGLSEDEKPIASLRARYSDWFKPYPNWASVFHHMQQNSLYREFRTGDVELEQWQDSQTVGNRLKRSLDFLWY